MNEWKELPRGLKEILSEMVDYLGKTLNHKDKEQSKIDPSSRLAPCPPSSFCPSPTRMDIYSCLCALVVCHTSPRSLRFFFRGEKGLDGGEMGVGVGAEFSVSCLSWRQPTPSSTPAPPRGALSVPLSHYQSFCEHPRRSMEKNLGWVGTALMSGLLGGLRYHWSPYSLQQLVNI